MGPGYILDFIWVVSSIECEKIPLVISLKEPFFYFFTLMQDCVGRIQTKPSRSFQWDHCVGKVQVKRASLRSTGWSAKKTFKLVYVCILNICMMKIVGLNYSFCFWREHLSCHPCEISRSSASRASSRLVRLAVALCLLYFFFFPLCLLGCQPSQSHIKR